MMGVTSVSRDLQLLRPQFLRRVLRLLARCKREDLRFEVFEAFRTRERQDWLYGVGRTRPGHRVTWVQAGWSFHEYGAAVDLVRFVDGRWSWGVAGADGAAWRRMHELATLEGCEVLAQDLPHVQEAGITIEELRRLSREGVTAHGGV